MALLTSQVITDAYYTSKVISREFETPTGTQMTDGLKLLNQLISDRTINEGTIPYTDKLAFNAVAGTQEYYLENAIDIEIFTFYIESIRYETRNQQRKDYFGSFRATNINSLPFNWHFEREFGGGRLYLYFTPNQAYPLEVWGSFRLSSVTMFQDLSLTLDSFYTNYLEYLLADRICQFNSYATPPDVKFQLDKYNKWIANSTNVMDLRQRKISTLTNGNAINYGYVNLSNGWTPV